MMKYRTVDPNEFKLIAVLHKLAFSDFFLATLGLGFLKTYYKACLLADDSIAVCAVNSNNIIKGFATGSWHAAGYHKKLFLSNLISFSWRGMILIFTNPKALFRLLKNLDKTPNPEDDRNYAELLSIAILPELKGTSVGKELLQMFELEAFKRGQTRVALTTDYNNNERVVAFYKKSGYLVYYDFITYPNRKMYKMIKDIHNVDNK
ncbi:MAG: hypothetical protein A2W98_00395 [Bacteroidetes bacterium GWF2_33_38]|nr:MAG: hypothetical protein A2W98_00395 [Bacteroidetes bacterium GWF2_33_38]